MRSIVMSPEKLKSTTACVHAWFARPGLQLGADDPRAVVSVGGPVQLMRVSMRHGNAGFGTFENVGTELYCESVPAIDDGMAELGVVRANKFDSLDDAAGVEIVRAELLGAPSVRARSNLAYEPADAEELIGPCPTVYEFVEAYLDLGPARVIRDILDPLEKRDRSLIIPGEFHPLTNPVSVFGQPCVDGYLVCGVNGSPLFFGSRVELYPGFGKEGVTRWRVFEMHDKGWYKGLPDDRRITGRHLFHKTHVHYQLPQRRPAISANNVSACNTAFGEGPEGPGKILLHDTELGFGVCRMFSSGELWRMGEDTDENLDIYYEANPHAHACDIARAAGEGVSRRYARAVIGRMLWRLHRYVTVKRQLAMAAAAIAVQARARGARVRSRGRPSARPAVPAVEDVSSTRGQGSSASVNAARAWPAEQRRADALASDGKLAVHAHGASAGTRRRRGIRGAHGALRNAAAREGIKRRRGTAATPWSWGAQDVRPVRSVRRPQGGALRFDDGLGAQEHGQHVQQGLQALGRLAARAEAVAVPQRGPYGAPAAG